jgi:hypothetical protein
MKTAGKEGVKFVKLLVRACIKNGKVIKSWNETRRIPIYEKESEEKYKIGNQSPSRTGSIGSSLAWWHKNLRNQFKTHIYSDSQKAFVKKANDCTEHRIILNKLRHAANKNKPSLIEPANDFTNAFG